MVKLNRMFVEKLGGTDVTQYVGREGDMFFDPATGVLRVADGSTPGGIILGALGSTGYVGTFYDTTTQTNPVADQVLKMKFNTTDIADGVAIVSNTQIKVLHTGRWNIQFSAQVNKTDSGSDNLDIWLMKNGSNLPYTNTRVNVDGNNIKEVSSWNWVVNGAANDYFEIAWSSNDTAITLHAEGPTTGPTRPGIPSVILTVTQV